jgi:hypothetical protein
MFWDRYMLSLLQAFCNIFTKISTLYISGQSSAKSSNFGPLILAMKQFLSILFITVVCFSACKRKQEDVLASVRKHYAEINAKLKDYTPKHVDDISTPGGGAINGYYRDDEIKKIAAEHYADSCRTFSEYYFDDGMLIFVVKQNFIYNKPISYTEEKAKALGDSVWYDDKKTRLEVSRYYFRENKMVKWIQGESDMPVNTSEFIDKQSQILVEAVLYIKELKEQ